MSEILYHYKYTNEIINKCYDIRWLNQADYPIFCDHLRLCNQKLISPELWEQMYHNGTMYCGLFIEHEMVARACVEKYSETAWEVADVRTAKEFRNHGYAYQLCLFVLEFINNAKILATMRTEEDNFAMQSIINKLGFVRQ